MMRQDDLDVGASGDDDIDGTVVMGDRPPGEDSMKSGADTVVMPQDDSDVGAFGDDDIDGTVVMGDRPPGEDSMKSGADTVVMPQDDLDVGASGDDDIDGTVVMGDRPPGEDAMKSGADTVVMPQDDLPSTSDSTEADTIAGFVEPGMEKTQVFSKQWACGGLRKMSTTNGSRTWLQSQFRIRTRGQSTSHRNQGTPFKENGHKSGASSRATDLTSV